MHITKYFPKKVRKKPIFYVAHGQFGVSPKTQLQVYTLKHIIS